MSSPRLWTVRAVLDWTTESFRKQGLERSARLDAELLLARVLGCNRVGVYVNYDRPLSETERAQLRTLIVRRSRHEPMAYLLETREFYGLELAVDERALVPRPETEILVDEALERLDPDATGPVVDVGTGTGAIALALASERPALQVLAVEIEPGAAALAQGNAQSLEFADRVQVVLGDTLTLLAPESVDLVVSNPPYIAWGDERVEPGVLRWEPRRALFAPEDGLGVVRQLVRQSLGVLRPGGALLMELGEGQCEEVAQEAEALGLVAEGSRKDLAGIERVLKLRRPG